MQSPFHLEPMPCFASKSRQVSLPTRSYVCASRSRPLAAVNFGNSRRHAASINFITRWGQKRAVDQRPPRRYPAFLQTSPEVLYILLTHAAESYSPKYGHRSENSLIECQMWESNPQCATRPHLFDHTDQRRRLGKSPLTSVRQRRRALQIGARRAENARKSLGTIVVATKPFDVHRAWERFATIVVTAKSFCSANQRQRLGAVIITAAFANAVWNRSPVQEVVAECARGPW